MIEHQEYIKLGGLKNGFLSAYFRLLVWSCQGLSAGLSCSSAWELPELCKTDESLSLLQLFWSLALIGLRVLEYL